MTQPPAKPPSQKAVREEKLAKALRANLRRRKAPAPASPKDEKPS